MSSTRPPVEPTAPGLGLRRRPQQHRSRERLDRVVGATNELVVEVGPVQTTTAAIAERAGVSVAWIYRYFDDRQAIFDTIVLDAVHRLFEETQHAAQTLTEGAWRDGVRTVLDVNIRFYAREPAFVRLWNSEFRSTTMLATNRMHDEDQARWFYDTLTSSGVLRHGPDAERACRLVVALADRGLELAFAHDDDGDRTIVDQLGGALIAVLLPYTTTRATTGP